MIFGFEGMNGKSNVSGKANIVQSPVRLFFYLNGYFTPVSCFAGITVCKQKWHDLEIVVFFASMNQF